MAEELPTTSAHRGPVKPGGSQRMPALICAFPHSFAVALPPSGSVIGRSWFAQQGLTDGELSNEHLRVDHGSGHCHIADAGSRNGTWVNGARLSPSDHTPLEDGSIVRIGRSLFVYRAQFSGPLEPAPPLGKLVGAYGLRAVADSIAALPKNQSENILIEGETGVGKELIAHEIARELRRGKPFAAVNVAGVAATVFESQMFGHVAGAFSDARAAAPGILVAHQGGTIFLDEIGELALEAQTKLLRVLENREVLPVGAAKAVRVDVSIVAATNRDVEVMVEQNTFRRDLFARFAKSRIQIPALRDRAEDLFGIAVTLSERDGSTLPSEQVEVEAIERMMLHDWPTNVRELDALLATVRRSDPQPGLRLWAVEQVLGKVPTNSIVLTAATVEAAIRASGGNLSAAAERLGVSRGKLLRFRKRTIV
jgi:MoxR-like ATPase